MSKMLEYIQSEQGQADIKEYRLDLERKAEIFDAQIDRFWSRYENDLDAMDIVVQKIVDKYASKTYRDNWYGRGIEPTEELFYFLYEVAKKYGTEFDAKLRTSFTKGLYNLGNWDIELIVGQGSAILINKR